MGPLYHSQEALVWLEITADREGQWHAQRSFSTRLAVTYLPLSQPGNEGWVCKGSPSRHRAAPAQHSRACREDCYWQRLWHRPDIPVSLLTYSALAVYIQSEDWAFGPDFSRDAWPWASHIASLCLSLPICQKGHNNPYLSFSLGILCWPIEKIAMNVCLWEKK